MHAPPEIPVWAHLWSARTRHRFPLGPRPTGLATGVLTTAYPAQENESGDKSPHSKGAVIAFFGHPPITDWRWAGLRLGTRREEKESGDKSPQSKAPVRTLWSARTCHRFLWDPPIPDWRWVCWRPRTRREEKESGDKSPHSKGASGNDRDALQAASFFPACKIGAKVREWRRPGTVAGDGGHRPGVIHRVPGFHDEECAASVLISPRC